MARANTASTPARTSTLTLLSAEDAAPLWADLLGGFAMGELGGEILAPGSDTTLADGALQWPLPVAGTITSPQGYRTDPITGETSYHSGTDIALPEGTPILAAADGTVTIANALDSWGGSYGYHVKLDHGGGLTTLYAHCLQHLRDRRPAGHGGAGHCLRRPDRSGDWAASAF